MVTAFIVLFIIGIIFGALLAFAGEKFKVEEDPRLEQVTDMLPGYNCGACGHSGCAGLAIALLSKEIDMVDCIPIKAEDKSEIIDYLANTPGPDGQTIEIKQ